MTDQYPDWKNVVIRDLTNDQTVVDLSPNGTTQSDADVLRLAANAPIGKMVISDMILGADGKPTMHALMKFRPSPSQEYLLEVELSPSMVQNVLMR